MDQSTERTLVKKMAEVMKAVKYIEKKGFNKHNNYKYIREEDVLEAIREQMADRNLMIFQEIMDQDVTESGKTKSGATKWLTTIRVKFTIADGDSGEERSIISAGQGEDQGDKGVYKAITGCNKYALLKLFMIPTGDDPENDGGHQSQGNQRQGSQQRPQNNNQRQDNGGEPPRNQLYGNNQQGQGQQQQKQGTQAPPASSVAMLKDALEWSDQEMIENINAIRMKKGADPVAKYGDMSDNWKAAIFNAMLKIFENKQGGSQ